MLFSETVVRDLARVWTRLHRSAARTHLECLIRESEHLGDRETIVNYQRVLAQVIAYEEEHLADGDTQIRSNRLAG
jgi:hypothetical protein